MIKTDYKKIAFLADGGYGDWLPIVSLMREFKRCNPQLRDLFLFVKLKAADENEPYGSFPRIKDYYTDMDFITDEIFIPYEANTMKFICDWQLKGKIENVVAVMSAYGREYLLFENAIHYNLIRGLVENHVKRKNDFELSMKSDHNKLCDERFTILTKGFKASVGFHTRLFDGEFHWRGRGISHMDDNFMMDLNNKMIRELTSDKETVVLLFGNNHRYGSTIKKNKNVRFVKESNVLYELELANKCEKFIGAYSGFSIITSLRKRGLNYLPLHTYLLPNQPGLIPRADGDFERYYLLGGERIDYLFHYNVPYKIDFMCTCPNTVENAMRVLAHINLAEAT